MTISYFCVLLGWRRISSTAISTRIAARSTFGHFRHVFFCENVKITISKMSCVYTGFTFCDFVPLHFFVGDRVFPKKPAFGLENTKAEKWNHCKSRFKTSLNCLGRCCQPDHRSNVNLVFFLSQCVLLKLHRPEIDLWYKIWIKAKPIPILTKKIEKTKFHNFQKLTNESWCTERLGFIYALLDQCDRWNQRSKMLFRVLKPKNFNSYTKQCKIVFSLL